ncbi:hypothetical protein [Haloferula rosea]|uniref:PEP-CTERM protein-sorting domain-containing protein n=1 Tax=Haloferula rosea TaxID=490093 RepID=A0A934RD44_9BACT|nr:hypothetical protein [Haloferula rosea]MBK1826841.1 hypothetical protein [Haloferula rosea]
MISSHCSNMLPIVSCSFLFGSFSPAAVVFEDDFSSGAIDGTKWDLGSLSEEDSGSFETTADGALGFVTAGSVTGVRPIARLQAISTLPQTSDWTLTVTMNIGDLSDLSSGFGDGDGAALTVQIASAYDNGDRLEVNLAAINFGGATQAVRSADRLDPGAPGGEDSGGNINDPIVPVGDGTASTATIILSYDATTQKTNSAYRFNGGPLTTFGFESDLSEWTTGVGDLFVFKIEGSAGNFGGGGGLVGPVDLDEGELAFDNVRLEDTATALPAVPEPSVTLLGALGVLGLIRRRVR